MKTYQYIAIFDIAKRCGLQVTLVQALAKKADDFMPAHIHARIGCTDLEDCNGVGDTAEEALDNAIGVFRRYASVNL